MKKTLNVLLSAVIIITLLFAYALPASAEEITLGASMCWEPVLNTNAALYYSYLTNYFGYNVKGTCSHNALALLLTFYDTYHNDDYVHESLDYQTENELYGSPGTLYENDLYDEFVVQGGASYYNYIYQYSLSSLHLYLIELAMDMGLYEDENGVSTLPENPNAVSFGLYEDQIIALLEEYLSRRHNSMCDRTVVMHESCLDLSQDQLVRIIAEKIEQGIPVMCLNYRSASEDVGELAFNGQRGHAVIAYDCDDISNPTKSNIVIHNGYHNTNKRTEHMLQHSNSFDYIYGIIWLDTSEVPHVCSDNYGFMCGCQVGPEGSQ